MPKYVSRTYKSRFRSFSWSHFVRSCFAFCHASSFFLAFKPIYAVTPVTLMKGHSQFFNLAISQVVYVCCLVTGGTDSLCGYQIRFESRGGPKNRLSYCTTGVLLRKLQIDTNLSNVTHIVVDEVCRSNL